MSASGSLERHATDPSTQHNPGVTDGNEASIEYFERVASEFSRKQVEVERSLADGDLAVLRWHQTWPGDQRLRRNRHLQVIPGTAAKENGMF